MTTVLVVLTLLEIAIVVGALAAYIIVITRRLENVSRYLGKISFGVRAVETQTGAIGPSVLRINQTLKEIDTALGPIVDKARRAAAS